MFWDCRPCDPNPHIVSLRQLEGSGFKNFFRGCVKKQVRFRKGMRIVDLLQTEVGQTVKSKY